MYRHLSLQRKYALMFCVLITGAVMATSIAGLYGVYGDHQMAQARLEESEARGAAARIQQFLADTERDLSSAAPAFWAAGGGTLDQRVNDYQRLLSRAPAITDVLYVNALGREQVRVSRLGLNLIESDVDHSQDPLYVAARGHSPAYSGVTFRDGTEPYLRVAEAEPGPNGGVLIADVNLKFIWDVISGIRVGKRGLAYVVDADGILIAHPDISLVLRRSDMLGLAQVRAATANPLPGGGAMIAEDRRGRHVLSAFETVQPVNWRVFTEQPLEEAYAPVIASAVRSVLVLMLGIAAAFLASIVAARRMVRPIEALEAGTARIGSGVLDKPIAIRTGDELERLADEINGMTDRLRASYVALEQTTAERERREQELRIARDIQQRLLPRQIAVPDGWSINTHYQPARVVGGDLYDLITLPDGRLGLVIGDVAGEGVPAALLMATTRTILRSVVAQGATSPAEVLARANTLLYPDTPHNLFVTCLYAVLDPRTGQLRYANAGHVPPLRRTAGPDGTVNQLRARGMPLGLMPTSVYEEKEATVAHGETVLFYSDGLTEAHDAQHQMFDIGRLTSVTSDGSASGSALIQRVLAALGRFTGAGWEQEDDLMLLTLERQEQENPACLHPLRPRPWTSTRPDPTPALSTSVAK